MYQCSKCGSDDPDHACPVQDVKSDPELDAGEKVDGGPQEDKRAHELRQHDETEAEWRLRRILEMTEEGLDPRDIGSKVNVSDESVRHILRKHRLNKLEQPLKSSLAVSLTNHRPSEAELERIKEIRHAADELCSLLDRVCLEGRELSLAKTHLEETVTWSVKALVLPREGGKVLTTEQWQQREARRHWDEA